MEKQKIYLDTSIPSAFFDQSKPVRQLITQKWFENESANFVLYSSVITIDEVDKFLNVEKKENINRLLVDCDVTILQLSKQAQDLADEYIKSGAIPKTEPEDALHIAIATLNEIKALASWNFKHIVSFNPIRKIHEINYKLHHGVIEIGSLELFGGAQYGNI